MDTDTGIPLTH